MNLRKVQITLVFCSYLFSVYYENQLLLQKVFNVKFYIHWYIIHVLEKNVFYPMRAWPGNPPQLILTLKDDGELLSLGSILIMIWYALVKVCAKLCFYHILHDCMSMNPHYYIYCLQEESANFGLKVSEHFGHKMPPHPHIIYFRLVLKACLALLPTFPTRFYYLPILYNFYQQKLVIFLFFLIFWQPPISTSCWMPCYRH